MTLEISFRPGVGEDVKYLKATWLHGFRDGEGVRDVPNSIYYDYEGTIMQHTIPRCSNANGVIVAYEALPEGTSFLDTVEAPIIGYIVAEAMKDALLIHYVYAKGHERPGKKHGKQFRNQGVARALIERAQTQLQCKGLPIRYTYRTPDCWQNYGWRTYLRRINATYVPYLKFTLLPSGWETGAVGKRDV